MISSATCQPVCLDGVPPIPTSRRISKGVSNSVQALPDDQGLHGSHIQSLECIDDTETVLSGVQSNLVEISLNKSLLLDELDVGERVGGQFDSLECQRRFRWTARTLTWLKPFSPP
jgi:hypothetical protein